MTAGDIEVVNIVATVDTGRPFQLDELATRLPRATPPEHGAAAHWVQFRLQPEGLYVAFYKTGKFLVTGCKSLVQVQDVVDRITGILSQLGHQSGAEKVRVHNIVAKGSVETPLQLDVLYQSLPGSRVSYEPEQFPGLILRVGGCRFLLFATGSFVCTGAKSLGEIRDAVEFLRRELREAGVLRAV